MAWGAKARNNSANTRRVNYHENEGPGKGRGPQRDDEKWSKGAKVVAGGVVLFVIANTGFGPIVETAQNVMDVFDFGKDAKEYSDTVKSNSKSNSKSSNKAVSKQEDDYSSVYKHIKNNVDLEASDVSDILQYLHGNLSESETEAMNTNQASAIFVDYECFTNEKKYIKNVMEKLDKYDDTVTFIAMSPNYLQTSDMQNEFDSISEMINNNLSGYDTIFNKISMNALINLPDPGNFVMSVTFYTE